MLILNVEAV